MVQVSKFRGDQSERIVPSLDKRDSPESGEDVELIIVQVNELQSFAQIDLAKRQLTDCFIVQDEFFEGGESLKLESMDICNIVKGEI